VDPRLLFQRRIIASKSLDDMSAIFKYELCSYPPSLFDSSLMLVKPQKPGLADAIWAKLSSDATGPKGEVQCVLDGGTLGLEDSQNIGRSVTCIVSIWHGSMVLQLSSSMITSKVPQKI